MALAAACGGGSDRSETPLSPTVITPPSVAPYAGTWIGSITDRAGRRGEITVSLPLATSVLSGTWSSTLGGSVYGGGTATAGATTIGTSTIGLILGTDLTCPSPIAGLPPARTVLLVNLTGTTSSLSGPVIGGEDCSTRLQPLGQIQIQKQ